MAKVGSNKFKFKSSGVKFDDRKFTKERTVVRPIGIKTPLEVGYQHGDIFRLHTLPAAQLKDNLRNLILTNHGERLGDTMFGANLKNIVFDLTNSENFQSLVVKAITNSAQKYIPAIQITDIAARVAEEGAVKFTTNALGLSLITVRVTYAIPALGIINQALEVTLYIGG